MNFGEQKIAPLFNRDGVYATIGSLKTGSAFSYRGGYCDRSLVRGRGVWTRGPVGFERIPD